MTSFPNQTRFRANSPLVTDQSERILELMRSKKYKVIGAFNGRGKTVDFMNKKTRVRYTFSTHDYNRAREQLKGW